MVTTLSYLFVSMRPKQWVKNLFVFAPLLFVKAFTDMDKVRLALFAFILFSLAGSAIYLINDCLDQKSDRLHPTKKNRPIASGKLSRKTAFVFAVLLGAGALAGSFVLNVNFGYVLSGYVLLNVLYSLKLKHLIVLDVFSIALGFVLRVVAGAVVIGVPVSVWILACTFFLALFLAVNKRKSELGLKDGETRSVLKSYTPEVLGYMHLVCLSATVITYVLYTFSSEHSRLLMLTIPVVLYGLFYYTAVLSREGASGGDPTAIVLRERPLQIAVALWVGMSGLILLFAN